MIVKSLRIFYKTFFIVLNDGFFSTVSKSYIRFRTMGRKGVTKGINNSYKELIHKDEAKLYLQWIQNNEKLEKTEENLSYNPLISIVMPTYNTDPKWLRKAIDSVLNQSYKNWELCIADDASTLVSTVELLKKYENQDKRIQVIYRKKNGHIAKASNSALSLAEGEYVTFLDHDDELASFAFYEMIKAINHNRNLKLIYSDEDKIDEKGKRFNPHFKSSWNPDMFFSQNYISHLTIIKKEVIDKTKKFRVAYEGSQDYDLFLQCLKFLNANEIAHVSKILYHWRAIDGSTAKDSTEKSYTTNAGIKALRDYFKDKPTVSVKRGFLDNTYKVSYKRSNNPFVSIIIPTKDNYSLLKICIESIFKKTEYKYYEIIIVDNQTTQVAALKYLNKLNSMDKIKVIQYDKTFNYAAINNYAAEEASGEFIAFLNNDIEVINKEWLSEMLGHAKRKEIGIVGAKLYYPDMTIQHGGVVLGIGGVAGHAHKHFDSNEHGYFSRLKIIQNYSALTAACIVIKKDIFKEVNGFEEELVVAFNDIDLSLKVLEKGYRNLWTPYAELIHHESKSRGMEDSTIKRKRFDKEKAFMQNKWQRKLLEDKCYNQNLTLEHENFSLRIEEKN